MTRTQELAAVYCRISVIAPPHLNSNLLETPSLLHRTLSTQRLYPIDSSTVDHCSVLTVSTYAIPVTFRSGSRIAVWSAWLSRDSLFGTSPADVMAVI